LKNSKEKRRYIGIDALRGWLIVFVMIGHLILGSVHDNFVRYSIYAFHMPLFIGLTGYLINADSLRQNAFLETMRHYWWRVLLPFSFAFAFFTGVLLIHAISEGRVSAKLVVSFFHTPYYHLWFIPTLVLWVLGFSLCLKLRIKLRPLLYLFLFLSLIWAGLPKLEQWPIVQPVLSKKVFYFFSFFLFGAWLRTPESKKFRAVFKNFKVLPITLIMFCAGLYLLNIGHEKSFFRAAIWLIMNLTLITFLINEVTSIAVTNEKKSVTSEMGRLSLPIYLWHFAPLFILKGYDIHQTQPLIYYSLGITSMAIICFAVLRLQGKSKFLDRCLYGAV
jgi:fucose 4-O-acetylase-like acetyltransferase